MPETIDLSDPPPPKHRVLQVIAGWTLVVLVIAFFILRAQLGPGRRGRARSRRIVNYYTLGLARLADLADWRAPLDHDGDTVTASSSVAHVGLGIAALSSVGRRRRWPVIAAVRRTQLLGAGLRGDVDVSTVVCRHPSYAAGLGLGLMLQDSIERHSGGSGTKRSSRWRLAKRS